MLPEEQLPLSLPGGVGGRQRDPVAPDGGGGYPNICNAPKRPFGRATLEKIADAGVRGPLFEVAELLGPELFLQVWQKLDQENVAAPRGQREPTKIYVPCYSSWVKAERNEIILALDEAGESPKKIERQLEKMKCEPIGARHIASIIRSNKIDRDEQDD